MRSPTHSQALRGRTKWPRQPEVRDIGRLNFKYLLQIRYKTVADFSAKMPKNRSFALLASVSRTTLFFGMSTQARLPKVGSQESWATAKLDAAHFSPPAGSTEQAECQLGCVGSRRWHASKQILKADGRTGHQRTDPINNRICIKQRKPCSTRQQAN